MMAALVPTWLLALAAETEPDDFRLVHGLMV